MFRLADCMKLFSVKMCVKLCIKHSSLTLLNPYNFWLIFVKFMNLLITDFLVLKYSSSFTDLLYYDLSLYEYHCKVFNCHQTLALKGYSKTQRLFFLSLSYVQNILT